MTLLETSTVRRAIYIIRKKEKTNKQIDESKCATIVKYQPPVY